MEKPITEPSGPPLIELIWRDMVPSEDPKFKTVTPEWIEEIYQVGAVDQKRFRLVQWQAAFAKAPQDEAGYLISAEHCKKLSSFLYQGKIKKPFEVARLKDGARPAAWLEELYLKVLRFETTLSFEAWKKLIQAEVRPRFQKGEKLVLNPTFRQWLNGILQNQASALRTLELWYQEKSQLAAAPPPSTKKEPDKTPTKWESMQDSFNANPGVAEKSAAIHQVFYHSEQHPQTDDRESLDFLDQLADLDEEGSDKL